MAEKLFTRHNLAEEPVKAGDIIDARIDGAMAHYHFMDANKLAQQAGLPQGIPRVWDPDKVYFLIDHHQPALSQSIADDNAAIRREAERLGLRIYYEEPGIAHQMMLDYGLARPGELVVGMDSHTIGYGAINAGATGISRSDLAYAVVFGELWFQVPASVKVRLEGSHPNYPIAKDIVLYLAGEHGDDFAQNMSIEFCGSLVPQMSIGGRGCLSTHGVEVAAKFALFAADAKTHAYVRERTDKAYEAIEADADAVYEREIVLDVDRMPFVVARPHQFGNVAPVDEVKNVRVHQAQIGSCANGRYEDIVIAARMLKSRKVARGVRFIVSPASQQVYLQCLKDRLIAQLVESGAQVVTPGCGVCQPKVGFVSAGEVCITATTRNFRGRKGSLEADIYLGGPLTVTAAAVAGEIMNPKEVFHELRS
jgi:3-isopropylmalate/(R)-2-methylmalate dehydratase large subunit